MNTILVIHRCDITLHCIDNVYLALRHSMSYMYIPDISCLIENAEFTLLYSISWISFSSDLFLIELRWSEIIMCPACAIEGFFFSQTSISYHIIDFFLLSRLFGVYSMKNRISCSYLAVCVTKKMINYISQIL